MAGQTEGFTKAFKAGEAIVAFRLVYLSAEDTVLYADAGHPAMGVAQENAAINTSVSVAFLKGFGTHKAMASAAITAAAVVYAAADGKVSMTELGRPLGRALEAASADGSVIEFTFDPFLTCDVKIVTAGSGGITAGDLVYASDQTAGVLTVLPAQGTSGGNYACGICPNAITAAAQGVMLTQWLKHGYDTSASSACNAAVYLSDGTAGAHTFTKPTTTDKVQIVGRVVEDHATTGAVLFQLPGTTMITHTHADDAEGGATLGDHTSGQITMGDAKDIVLNTTTGTKIGTATGQKLAFHNATPTDQCAAYTQTYSTADRTHAAATQQAVSCVANITGATENYEFQDSSAQVSQAEYRVFAKTIKLLFEQVAADILDLKQLVNSVIDDLQEKGLVG